MGIFNWLRRADTLSTVRVPPRCSAPEAALFENILKRLREMHGAPRVLEIGCGVGLLSLRMVQAAPSCSLTGLDTSSDAIRSASGAAREAGLSGRCTFCVSELRLLPVADAGFDCVVAVHALCESVAPAATLREIHRVLAPGGMAHLLEPLVVEERVTPTLPLAWRVRGVPFEAAELQALIAASPFAKSARINVPAARGRDAHAELLLLRRPSWNGE